ncbi:MAG: hypothetical protein IJY17_09350 [Alphaproteobacteria bacterium]|nr:hypothetical protein [Alphaproteobacteria bacterium]
MTVSSAVNKIAYTANGTSKDFTVPFYFIYKSDLKVYRMNENVQELLTLDTDYTVTGTPELPDGSIYKNGGTVVMTATPAAGTRFIILREVPLTQEADYQEGSTFPAALHELALDKLTMAVQQLKEQTDRSVTVDVFSDTDPSSLVSEIEALYDVKDEVITAAENIGSIVTAAQDINAIKDAPNQANSARNSAIFAQNSAVTAQLMAAQAGESVSAAAASASAAETSAAASASSAQTAHDYALQAVRNNIGDFFYTSRLDTELNGAVECNGATYSVSAFTGPQAAPALLAAGKLPYVGIAIFDALVAANGSCRAWGWDGADATVFKVPKLNDVYLMAGTAASVGEFIDESLPNIIGTTGFSLVVPISGQASGAFKKSTVSSVGVSSGGNNYGSAVLNLDASDSSSVYQNGAKVRPDSIRYRAFVQIATGAIDEALETCTGVLADVAGLKEDKANTDLSNCTKPYVTETYHSGTEWYRVWSDGWIEQGGVVKPAAVSTAYQANFVKPFSQVITGVFIQSSLYYAQQTQANDAIAPHSFTQFTYVTGNPGSVNQPMFWRAYGY